MVVLNRNMHRHVASRNSPSVRNTGLPQQLLELKELDPLCSSLVFQNLARRGSGKLNQEKWLELVGKWQNVTTTKYNFMDVF